MSNVHIGEVTADVRPSPDAGRSRSVPTGASAPPPDPTPPVERHLEHAARRAARARAT